MTLRQKAKRAGNVIVASSGQKDLPKRGFAMALAPNGGHANGNP